ncbi:T9SS type B sorting domain-containing protein [Maribacter halichondriae]|uniref:T9SS type B sorting domain-containing protein n=1 Tax=Maribacter halichondriae TaxID=2980554 RepID=UPI002359F878|nr:T9SS type B sorting domain-containing protein [Maribacter sp. Hal144]
MLGKSPFPQFVLMALTALSCLAQAPSCPSLTLPTDGATGVSISTNLEWEQVDNATSYILSVGTSPNGNEILNAVDVGDFTSYDLMDNLPAVQLIYVRIVPYNQPSNIYGTCSVVSFTTGDSSAPQCTEIINPTDGDELVLVTANITWIRNFSATGYFMSVYEGDPNGIVIWDNEDVGNGTNFKPPDFKPRTLYFVTITPRNESGPAVGCNPISFTTGDGPMLPFCTELILPEDGSVDVPVDTALEWAPVTGVDGYLISVGTTPRGTDIVDNEDVGNGTSYQLLNNLPIGQRIYVLITPYEGQLQAENCLITSFTVEGPPTDEIENIVPSFFTPNSDNFNDEFIVRSSQNITVQNIFIFDRFGKLLKQLPPDQPWDGTFNGQRLPSGTYWYSLDILNSPNIRGYFLLKR